MTMPDDLSSQTDAFGTRERPAERGSTPERIQRLLTEQPYAVLCTQSRSQPYGSLVAFAVSDDLKTLVFSTPTTTRKYRLLIECEHVALLIDSRSACPGDMMQIEAVTATGRAQVIAPGTEFERWAELLAARHPHLSPFIRAESSALIRVDVVRYLHVCRFQEVCQWIPGSDS